MAKKLNPWKIPTLTLEMYEELKRFYSLEDILEREENITGII